MFSYRHAFHAGNHADVLKHTVLVATLRHLVQKDAALAVFDTHGGAGLYRLDGDYAAKSGEAADGLLRLRAAEAVLKQKPPVASAEISQAAIDTIAKDGLAPAVLDYLELVAGFNAGGSHKVYPGSPFIAQRLLRAHDKLKCFEIHPTDARTLDANLAQLEAGRQVSVLREDGFEALKKYLPPPARRALVLMDPSYEMKIDYARVLDTVGDALRRFATGTYAVWYPIIPRPEAHDLPRRLRTLATKAGKPWLHATLTVKNSRLRTAADGSTQRPGLPASGMFLVNPPFTLKPALAAALPQLALLLAQDPHAASSLESSG